MRIDKEERMGSKQQLKVNNVNAALRAIGAGTVCQCHDVEIKTMRGEVMIGKKGGMGSKQQLKQMLEDFFKKKKMKCKKI